MLAVLLCLAAWLAGPAAAADSQPPVIRFGVRVLQASNAPATIGSPPPAIQRGLTPAAPPGPRPAQDPDADERLQRLLPRLRQLFRYSDYTTLERHRIEGPLGIQQRFPIPGERWLEVTPDQMQQDAVRMKVRLLKGNQAEMNANILAAPGAPAVLGGPAHGNGVLIIILWANPRPRPE
jgi:hypothetical protein